MRIPKSNLRSIRGTVEVAVHEKTSLCGGMFSLLTALSLGCLWCQLRQPHPPTLFPVGVSLDERFCAKH